MKPHTFVPLSVLTLSLLIGAGALATYARQGSDASGQKQIALTGENIAVVDMDQIYEVSDAPALEAQKAAEIDQQEAKQLERINAVPYLNQQQLVEFLGIVTMPAPTPAQEARAKELTALSDKCAQEMDALRVKKDAALNAQDKKRMQELQDESQMVQNLMPKIERKLMTDGEAALTAFHREQMRRLHAIVGKVAASKGILDVWDSESLVYSAHDITSEVIRKMGKQPVK